jgi:hypothetical protein
MTSVKLGRLYRLFRIAVIAFGVVAVALRAAGAADLVAYFLILALLTLLLGREVSGQPRKSRDP